nr:hypothetical protein [Segatella paludivivens]
MAGFVLNRPVLPLPVAIVRDGTVGGTDTQGKGAVEADLGTQGWNA